MTLLVAGLLAVAFVTEVNKLCAQLLADFLEVSEPRPGKIAIEDYKAEQPKIQALLDEFDAKVDAIAVSDVDRPAAAAFDAYRHMSDETDAKLGAAAATGDQAAFDAAVEERHRTFDASSVLQDLAASGIGCNAR